MSTSDIREQVALALKAVENKKAEDVALLQLPHESSAFTDYFLICSGNNARQVQAIADEVDERLSKDMRVEPNAREGYETAEWILLDYVDFVVHIFNAERRAYYDLERLWKSAHRLTLQELLHPKAEVAPAVKAPAAKKPAAKKPAKRAAATGRTRKGTEKPAKKSAKSAAKKAASGRTSAQRAAKAAARRK
jgi:ribosome-associated protein